MICSHCASPAVAKGFCKAHYLKTYQQLNRERLTANARERAARNSERISEYKKAWAQRNREHLKQKQALLYAKNRQARIAAAAEWRRANPESARINSAAQQARRRAAQRRATPAWANHEEIRGIYAKCVELSATTGVPHEVDHVIPLAGVAVCGLHVHWNLRVVPASVNRSKGNRLEIPP